MRQPWRNVAAVEGWRSAATESLLDLLELRADVLDASRVALAAPDRVVPWRATSGVLADALALTESDAAPLDSRGRIAR
jgi:hypothetical protein